MSFKFQPIQRFPWTVLFFLAILYFTLFDQPGFLPSARTFTVLLVLFIFVPWLGLLVWQRRPFIPTPLDYPLLLLALLHLASALFSANFRLTYFSLWLLLLSILTFYFMLHQLRAGREKAIWQALFLVITIILCLAVVEFLSWYFGFFPPLGHEISWPAVAGWSFPPNPIRLGFALLTVPVAPPFSGYVALLIPAAIGFALSTPRLTLRLGLISFTLLAVIIMLLSFSRTGLVALAAGLIVMAGLSWYTRASPSMLTSLWQPKHRYLLLALGASLALIATVLFLNRAYYLNYLIANREGSNEIRGSLLQAARLMWQDHPLLGAGPGLFGLFYRNYLPANNLYFISISAHSVYFQLLAETGLLGVLATISLLIISILTLYKRLPTIKDASKLWQFIGVTASLTVFLTTAAIEHIWFLPFIIPFGILSASFFSHLAAPVENYRVRLWLPRIYLVALIALAGVLIYSNNIAEQFMTLVKQTAPGQELVVAAELHRLQNSDPQLPMYTLSEGYFKGKHVIATAQVTPCTSPPDLPTTEKTILTEAIEAYRTALTPIKAHPLYWANLASLYWLDRQPETAQQMLDQAIQLSDLYDFKRELYWLNAGCYYELQGQTEPSITTYSQALAHNPNLIASPFWQASEFRASHLAAIIEVATQIPPNHLTQVDTAIKIEMARDNFDRADTLTDQLIQNFPDDPTALRLQAQKLLRHQKYPESQALATRLEDYQLLGEIALAQGDQASARQNLQKAIFLNTDDTEAYFYLAQTALAENNRAEAITYLKRITLPLIPPTTTDTRFVYGYPTDLPIYDSLLLIQPPPLQGRPFELLIRIYKDLGQPDLAETVKQALLTYDPYLKN
ncbi:MAG: O-antigen ligase family protein [Anaerolineae bacterium]